jgi:hypothetical protein
LNVIANNTTMEPNADIAVDCHEFLRIHLMKFLALLTFYGVVHR